jgi:hypothetical protein
VISIQYDIGSWAAIGKYIAHIHRGSGGKNNVHKNAKQRLFGQYFINLAARDE